MTVIYDRIARGYATQYLNSLPAHDDLIAWFDGPRSEKALEAFERSCAAKKPGRVLKRLALTLRPMFFNPLVRSWTKHEVSVKAFGYTAATENYIFRMPDDMQPLYSEKAVFETTLYFDYLAFDCIETHTTNYAAVSHHAISRMVERGAVDVNQLSATIPNLLRMCSDFAMFAFATEIDFSEMQSFLLPWNNGALVLVFMEMDPNMNNGGKERQQILSVRTFLNEKMLSEQDEERMRGFPDGEFFKRGDTRDVFDFLSSWMRGNARPWEFSDSTLEGNFKNKCW